MLRCIGDIQGLLGRVEDRTKRRPSGQRILKTEGSGTAVEVGEWEDDPEN